MSTASQGAAAPPTPVRQVSTLDIDEAAFEYIGNYLKRMSGDSFPDATIEQLPGLEEIKQVTGLKHQLSSGDRLPAMSPLADDEASDESGRSSSGRKRRRVGWTNTEDLVILAAVRRIGTQWPRIAGHLRGRTGDAVRNRYHRLMKTHPLAADTDAVDGLLVDLGFDLVDLTEDSTRSAAEAAAAAAPGSSGGRSSPAVWVAHGPGSPQQSPSPPAPQPIRGADHGRAMWTKEEDDIIEEGVRRFGCKWRQIAETLPNRTDSSVRNRWMRLCKERQEGRRATPTGSRDSVPAGCPGLTPAALAAPEAALGPPAAEPDVAALHPEVAEAVEALGAENLPLGLDAPAMLVNLDSFYEAVKGVLGESLGDSGCSLPVLSPSSSDDANALGIDPEVTFAVDEAAGARLAAPPAAGTPRRRPPPSAGSPAADHSAPRGLRIVSVALTALAAIAIGAAARAAHRLA